MKNLFSIGKTAIAFLLLICILSCKKETLFQPLDKQISGQWKFDKVTFHRNLSFSTENITNDYNGNLLELKDDKSLNYIIGSNGQQLTGTWELRTKTTYLNDQSTTEYLLDVNVNQGESFLGTNVGVTAHKLTFYEAKNQGTYIYHFIR